MEIQNSPNTQASLSPEQPKQGKGCFFYGCLSAIVLLIVFVGAVTFASYSLGKVIAAKSTSEAPLDIPQAQLDSSQRQNLKKRIEDFSLALQSDGAVEKLVLHGEELNVLLDLYPELAPLKKSLYLKAEGDKIVALCSMPLNDLGLGVAYLKDRYVNAEAHISLSATDGNFVLNIEDLKIAGNNLPPEVLQEIRKENWATNFDAIPSEDDKLSQDWNKIKDQIERVEVKDSALIISPK